MGARCPLIVGLVVLVSAPLTYYLHRAVPTLTSGVMPFESLRGHVPEKVSGSNPAQLVCQGDLLDWYLMDLC